MQLVFFDLLVSFHGVKGLHAIATSIHTYMVSQEKASAHTLEMAISANVMR